MVYLKAVSGITPRLFIAAVLKLYGFSEAKDIIKTSLKTLIDTDNQLIITKKHFEQDNGSKDVGYKRTLMGWIRKCNNLNEKLMGLNQRLTGVRSRVHYIGLFARGLMREDSGMASYVRDEWPRVISAHEYLPRRFSSPSLSISHSVGPEVEQAPQPQHPSSSLTKPRQIPQDVMSSQAKNVRSLERALEVLDSVKYFRRDNDKLEMIAGAMTQYEVDIKSLKSHTVISVGLVSG